MEEFCFVCNELMDNSIKADLDIVTSYSEKPIYQMIEAFADTQLDLEEMSAVGLCQTCLLKFNEYDELITRAEAIQLDLTQLLLQKNSEYAVEEDFNVEQVTVKNEDTGDDDHITYEPIYFEAEDTEESIDPSLLSDYQMEVVVNADDTKENYGEPSQFYSRKRIKAALDTSFKERPVKNEDHEFLIVELDNKRFFQCDVCSKTFKDKSKLKTHREIHTTERNVVCKECGKCFKTMNCLRNHKRMHLPVRTFFNCDQCEKKYTQKIQLKKHIEIVHMNRRDFSCPTCGASFGTKSVLKMHMLSHSEFRSEECTVCGFKVHTKAKLRRHMKSHTGERDYECGICGKKFLYSYNVIAHVRNVHNKEKNPTFSPVLVEEVEEEGAIEYSMAYEEC